MGTHTVTALINTSLDDCKISLGHVTDLTLLRNLYIECDKLGLQSRAKLATRRIKQLKKGIANG